MGGCWIQETLGCWSCQQAWETVSTLVSTTVLESRFPVLSLSNVSRAVAHSMALEMKIVKLQLLRANLRNCIFSLFPIALARAVLLVTVSPLLSFLLPSSLLPSSLLPFSLLLSCVLLPCPHHPPSQRLS